MSLGWNPWLEQLEKLKERKRKGRNGSERHWIGRCKSKLYNLLMSMKYCEMLRSKLKKELGDYLNQLKDEYEVEL